MMTPNDGQRPSRLALGRYAAGELADAERADLEARLDDAARAHLAELESSRGALGPLDVAGLRARAAGVGPIDPLYATPAAANDHRAFRRWFGVLAVLAATVLAVLGLRQIQQGPVGDVVAFRGSDALQLFEASGRELRPWGGEALGAGDVIGFKVGATGHDGVVVLSVDGSGAVSVFWPERGDRPEPLVGDGLVPLAGTLTLDGAPGPEVFVAVFDRSVAEARAEVERVYADGGADGLIRWAEDTPDADAVEVPRR